MSSLFFYGTLRHRALLDLVLGRDSAAQSMPAHLRGHAVHWARGQAFPLILAQPGSVAEGLYVSGLGPQDLARLNYYEGEFDYSLVEVSVETGEGPRAAAVYFPAPDRWPVGDVWSLADWERDWAAINLRAAAEIMDQFGKVEAREIARWHPQIQVRAASWVRAQGHSTSQILRRGGTAENVEIQDRRQPYSKFFGLEEQVLRYRQFNGQFSKPVTLTAFVSGDAVTVLPYDPARDRVLIIEQFRFGPFARGDRHPWSLEPIAGRIDPGETPEAAAHREAHEEAGVQLLRLEHIASYYPTPGALTEYLISYLAIADLPDGSAGIGGEASEAEDIRGLLLSFDELMTLLASGEAENGPLILSAMWLAAERSRLRGEA